MSHLQYLAEQIVNVVYFPFSHSGQGQDPGPNKPLPTFHPNLLPRVITT